MNPVDEERIQERAEVPTSLPEEEEWSAEERAEIDVYRLLYRALAEEPEWALPPGFAETVARRAFARPERLWVWMLAPAALLTAAVGTLLALPAVPGVVAAAFRAGLAPLHDAPLPLLATATLTIAVTMLADRFLSLGRLLSGR